MSTHNIGFYEDLTKNIFELSSNTHLISSADRSNCTPRIVAKMWKIVFYGKSLSLKRSYAKLAVCLAMSNK